MLTTRHLGKAARITARTHQGMRPALPLSSFGARNELHKPHSRLKGQHTDCCGAERDNARGAELPKAL